MWEPAGGCTRGADTARQGRGQTRSCQTDGKSHMYPSPTCRSSTTRCSPPQHRQQLKVLPRSGFVFDGHFLCVQIFIEEVYTRHGVTLDPDSVVVDIGANIGLVRSRKQHRFWVLPWR